MAKTKTIDDPQAALRSGLAHLIEQHTLINGPTSDATGGHQGCVCGAVSLVDGVDDDKDPQALWADHLAEVLIAELHLTNVHDAEKILTVSATLAAHSG